MLEQRRAPRRHGGAVDRLGVDDTVGRGKLARHDERLVGSLHVLARDRRRHLLHRLARTVLREIGLQVVVRLVQRDRKAHTVVQRLQLRHVHLDDRHAGRLESIERAVDHRFRVGVEVGEEVAAVDAQPHTAQRCHRRHLAVHHDRIQERNVGECPRHRPHGVA